MAGRKKKKRTAARVILAIALLLAASALAVTYLAGGELSLAGARRAFSGLRARTSATEFVFEPGFDAVFAPHGDGIIAAGGMGVQAFDGYGEETARAAARLENPTVSASDGTAAVFDVGGTVLRILEGGAVKAAPEVPGAIIACSVGAGGAVALCTRESGGYKGCVTVYSAGEFEAIYKWYAADGYVLSASLADDNKRLAVLTVHESGSRLVLLDLNSTELKAEAVLDGELGLELRYLGEKLALVARDGVWIVDKNGGAERIFDFAGRYLRGYSLTGDGFIAVYLHDYAVGSLGAAETFSLNGDALGRLETDRELSGMSARGDGLALLWEDGAALYDKALELKTPAGEADSTVTAVILRRDGRYIAIEPRGAYIV
ncbi:MAG: DUF5711 family protein [Oscillospiraceae bacterium]|nr:DUF5711 family protein [Oscillospiraceae bacterium]